MRRDGRDSVYVAVSENGKTFVLMAHHHMTKPRGSQTRIFHSPSNLVLVQNISPKKSQQGWLRAALIAHGKDIVPVRLWT